MPSSRHRNRDRSKGSRSSDDNSNPNYIPLGPRKIFNEKKANTNSGSGLINKAVHDLNNETTLKASSCLDNLQRNNPSLRRHFSGDISHDALQDQSKFDSLSNKHGLVSNFLGPAAHGKTTVSKSSDSNNDGITPGPNKEKHCKAELKSLLGPFPGSNNFGNFRGSNDEQFNESRSFAPNNFPNPNVNAPSNFLGPNRPNLSSSFSGPPSNFSGPNQPGNFSAPQSNFSGPNQTGNFSAPRNFSGPNQPGNFSAPNVPDNFFRPNGPGIFSEPNKPSDFSGPDRPNNLSGPDRPNNFSVPNGPGNFVGPNGQGSFSGPNNPGNFAGPNVPIFQGPNVPVNFPGPNGPGSFPNSDGLTGFHGPMGLGNMPRPNCSGNFPFHGNYQGPNSGDFHRPERPGSFQRFNPPGGFPPPPGHGNFQRPNMENFIRPNFPGNFPPPFVQNARMNLRGSQNNNLNILSKPSVTDDLPPHNASINFSIAMSKGNSNSGSTGFLTLPDNIGSVPDTMFPLKNQNKDSITLPPPPFPVIATTTATNINLNPLKSASLIEKDTNNSNTSSNLSFCDFSLPPPLQYGNEEKKMEKGGIDYEVKACEIPLPNMPPQLSEPSKTAVISEKEALLNIPKPQEFPVVDSQGEDDTNLKYNKLSSIDNSSIGDEKVEKSNFAEDPNYPIMKDMDSDCLKPNFIVEETVTYKDSKPTVSLSNVHESRLIVEVPHENVIEHEETSQNIKYEDDAVISYSKTSIDESENIENEQTAVSDMSAPQCLISNQKAQKDSGLQAKDSVEEKEEKLDDFNTPNILDNDRLLADKNSNLSECTIPSLEKIENPKPDTTSLIAEPPKKIMKPLLGKEAAKKRLRAFTFFMKDKKAASKASNTTGIEEKFKFDTKTKDDEKPKKKKKKEKLSVIEQIKDEELRIKEALSLTNNIESFQSAYKTPGLNMLFNNPEALKNFENRSKDLMEMLESKKKTINEQIKGEQLDCSKENDIDENVMINEESSFMNRSLIQEVIDKELREKSVEKLNNYKEPTPKPINVMKTPPKNWMEFKKYGMTFEEFSKFMKEYNYKSRSRSPSYGRRDRKRRSMSKDRDYVAVQKHLRPFPEQPTKLISVNIHGKNYNAGMVNYTLSKPHISYCINSDRFDEHYWSRKELKFRNEKNRTVMKIINQFWDSLSNDGEDKGCSIKQRWWLDHHYLEETSQNCDLTEMEVEDCITDHMRMQDSNKNMEPEDCITDHMSMQDSTTDIKLKDTSSDYIKPDSSSLDYDENIGLESSNHHSSIVSTKKLSSLEDEIGDFKGNDEKKVPECHDRELNKKKKKKNKKSLSNKSQKEKKKKTDKSEGKLQREIYKLAMIKEDLSESLSISEDNKKNTNVTEEYDSDSCEKVPDTKEKVKDFTNVNTAKIVSGTTSLATVQPNKGFSLNDEYEAFINTLDMSSESSAMTSDITNISLDSSTMFKNDAHSLEENESKLGKNAEVVYGLIPSTKKEVKTLLLNENLTKSERKSLKKLKKKMKKEKLEKKRLKKQLKMKLKLEKKQQKQRNKVLLASSDIDYNTLGYIPPRFLSNELVTKNDKAEEDTNFHENILYPEERDVFTSTDYDPQYSHLENRQNLLYINTDDKCSQNFDSDTLNEEENNLALNSHCKNDVTDKLVESDDSCDDSQHPIPSPIQKNSEFDSNSSDLLCTQQTSSIQFSENSGETHSDDRISNNSAHYIQNDCLSNQLSTESKHQESMSSEYDCEKYSPSRMSYSSSDEDNVEEPVYVRSKEDVKPLPDEKATSLSVEIHESDKYSPSQIQDFDCDNSFEHTLDSIPMPPIISINKPTTQNEVSDNASFPKSSGSSSNVEFKTEKRLSSTENKQSTAPVVFRIGFKQSTNIKKLPLPGFHFNDDEEPPLKIGARSVIDELNSNSPRKDNVPRENEAFFDKPENENNVLQSNTMPNVAEEISDDQCDLLANKSPVNMYHSVSPIEDLNISNKFSAEDSITCQSKLENITQTSDNQLGKHPTSLEDSIPTSSIPKEDISNTSDSKEKPVVTDSKTSKRSSSKERRRSPPKRRRSRSPSGRRRSPDYHSSRRRSRSPRGSRNRHSSPHRRKVNERRRRSRSRSYSRSPSPSRYRGRSPARYRDTRREYSPGSSSKYKKYRPSSRSPKREYLQSNSKITEPSTSSSHTTVKDSSEDFEARPISSISNHFDQTNRNDSKWNWDEMNAYSADVDSDDKDKIPQPESPKRLSLDERLRQEHGLEVAPEPVVSSNVYPVSSEETPWQYGMLECYDAVSDGSQVIQVGNVLQVLPQSIQQNQDGDAKGYESSSQNKRQGWRIDGVDADLSMPPPSLQSKPMGSLEHGFPQPPPHPETITSPSPTPITPQPPPHHHPTDPITVPLRSHAKKPSDSPKKQDIVGANTLSQFASNPMAFISSLLASSASSPAGKPAGVDSPSTDANLPASGANFLGQAASGDSSIAHLLSVLQQQNVGQFSLDGSQVASLDSLKATLTAEGAAASSSPAPPSGETPKPVQPPEPTTAGVGTASVSSTASVEHPPPPAVDIDLFRKQRMERRERKRLQKEARREAKKQRYLLKAEAKRRLILQQKAARKERERQQEKAPGPALPIDEEDAEASILKEAMTEVPDLGSPVPDYEVEGADEDSEPESEPVKPRPHIPPPPEKGILLCPSIGSGDSERKTVCFADGVLPGYGSSPSGGEEIHSPPPDTDRAPSASSETPKEKRRRKKCNKKVIVKQIKEFKGEDSNGSSSPPPPPSEDPSGGAVIRLYPGVTHYTNTAPSTFVVYAQRQRSQYFASNPELRQAAAADGPDLTIPAGMLVHSSALTRNFSPPRAPLAADIDISTLPILPCKAPPPPPGLAPPL